MNRRIVIQGALAAAAALSSAGALAALSDRDLKALKGAVDAGFDSALRRIQDWIRLPTIAAEQLNIEQGADYMYGGPWGEKLVICRACAPQATRDRLAANIHFFAFTLSPPKEPASVTKCHVARVCVASTYVSSGPMGISCA